MYLRSDILLTNTLVLSVWFSFMKYDEFDLLGDTYRDYLRFKLDETFKYCPELDGVVLTLTEADFSVIHNSNPERYPPQ